MSNYPVQDRRLTNIATFSSFRQHCLSSNLKKRWVKNDEEEPICTGLYYIKHKDFLGDVDIAEYHINTKGKAFWCTAGKPTHWAEIETYEYMLEDGTPLYEDQ
jgi:hypothetical protein